MLAPGSVQVGRVVLRGAERGPSARLGVTSLLAGVDLHPRTIAPSATLLFRALHLAAPAGWAAAPGARAPRAWGHTLELELTAMAERAVRPRSGRIEGDPEVVLFLDEAELLACLARALGDRAQLGAWYWRALLSATPSLSAWVARAGAHPRALPAAFTLLDGWGVTARLVTELPEADAAQLTAAVARAHGATLPAEWPKEQRSPARFPAAPFGPWTPDVREVRGVGLTKATLLGAVRLLHHDPRGLSRPTFPAALGAWRAQPTRDEVEAQASADVAVPAARVVARTPGEPGAGAAPRGVAEGGSAQSASAREPTPAPTPELHLDHPHPHPAPSGRGTRPVVLAPEVSEGTSGRPATRSPDHLVDPPPAAGAPLDPLPSSAEPLHRPEVRVRAPHRADAEPGSATGREDGEQVATSGTSAHRGPPLAPLAVASKLDEAAIVTELGGVFYLLNLLDAVGIPGCFEPEWRLAEQLGRWGVLALVARCLLAVSREGEAGAAELDRGDADALDPVWGLLAALDGRDPRAPGPPARFLGPRVVHLPEVWRLEPAPPPLARGLGLAALPEPLSAWLGAVAPYLVARLGAALEGAALGPVLRRRAEVFVTRTHVDVVERADRASLAARRAGLDRDPGWRPDLGRVVLFHFR